ncbi:hypothetical protein [Streptomyces malaysiensis]|uniref:hypothetical protein n=1 Tax=Streptomyces malaysiensis TaxID=92644 RepID=UPI00371E2D6B
MPMFTGLSAFPLTPLTETGIDETAFATLIGRLAAAFASLIRPSGTEVRYVLTMSSLSVMSTCVSGGAVCAVAPGRQAGW